MLPRGEDGYAINFNQVEPRTSNEINKTVSAMSFYAYHLMVRSTENRLLKYRQHVHQYLVDMYAKIEAERLLFIRLNLKKLRVDEYVHLKEANKNDSDPANHEKLVILPSTFTGCPRKCSRCRHLRSSWRKAITIHHIHFQFKLQTDGLKCD
ncbi:hypothetical protein AVEN_5597-1 [Araneus ventricosus]|uniref:Helitron helicase-like domain-containing protein n=1 Tax=Araneus ventricosus TaxID=182803 RepID=A0A4Y2D1L1_ARAVE|nr:hypothetical protein AVEN_5597-1 [Araneus ventricosus]